MKLLIPVDGSEESLHAVRYVLGLAGMGIELDIHLLNVQPSLPADVSRFVAREVVTEFHDEQGQEKLSGARELLDGAGLAYTSEVGTGNSAVVITERAAELGCDGIVMGSQGLGGVMGVLLGSTAQRVIHLSKLPVTLVR